MTHGQEETYPRVADVIGFVPTDKVVDVAEKVVLVQRDHGDRIERKHARLKYTVDDHGVDAFRELVEERLGYRLEKQRPYEFTENGDRYGWSENEDGTANYTFYVPGGRVCDTSEARWRSGFLAIAKILKGEFRLTGNQNLVVARISATQRAEVEKATAALSPGTGTPWASRAATLLRRPSEAGAASAA